jgi:hypothetical protein
MSFYTFYCKRAVYIYTCYNDLNHINRVIQYSDGFAEEDF